MYDLTVPDISEAFFRVEMRDVYVDPRDRRNAPIKLPRYAAVVDVNLDYVFAVVTDEYRLVTNWEAVELARQIMRQVFRITTLDDMECFNVTMPRTRSFCHIDLLHKNREFQPFPGDHWTAFIRVTNSYNRTRKLKFELGFCRGICRNGMIFGSRSVDVSTAHSHDGVERIRFERIVGDVGSVQALEALFTGQLQNLRRYHVPPSVMPSLFCKVFGIRVPANVQEKPVLVDRFRLMAENLDSLSSQYFDAMGQHAYAALNVLTDFASRPQGVLSAVSSMHGYQVAAARWMEEFIRAIPDQSFDFDRYLGDWKQEGEKLMQLLPPDVQAGPRG